MFKKVPAKIVSQNIQPTQPKASQLAPACSDVTKHERVSEQYDHQTAWNTNPVTNPQPAESNYPTQHLVGEPDLAPILKPINKIIVSDNNKLGGKDAQLSQD